MLLLVGESGAGKTTIEDYLIKNHGFKRAISHTSRAKRINDIDGVNYYFVSKEEMEDLYARNELVERIDYMGEIYGFVRSECQADRVAAVAPEGLEQLKQWPELNVYSIYLKVSDEVRKERMLNRGDAEESVNARLKNDCIIFAGVESMVDKVLDNNDKTVEEIVNEILQTMEK